MCQLLCYLLSIVPSLAPLLFWIHISYLVATVGHGKVDLPSLFWFYRLLPFSFLHTKTSQCLGDKIYVDKIGHELLIVDAGLKVYRGSLY